MGKVKNFVKKHKKGLVTLAVVGTAVVGGRYLWGEKTHCMVITEPGIMEVLSNSDAVHGACGRNLFAGHTKDLIPVSELGKLGEKIADAFEGADIDKLKFTHFIAIGPKIEE